MLNSLSKIYKRLGIKNIMELIPIVHNNTINSNEVEINYNYKKYIINIYNLCKITSNGLLHTLLLSIFETIFYWTYITKQERMALLRRLDEFKFILNLLCLNSNNKDIITEYLNYTDDISVNNEGPFKTSILLILVLFILSVISLILTLLIENLTEDEIIKHEKKKICFFLITKSFFINIKNSIPLFIFISIYEFLFFQMVIYYYQPISTHKMMVNVAGDCIS